MWCAWSRRPHDGSSQLGAELQTFAIVGSIRRWLSHEAEQPAAISAVQAA